MTPQTPLPPQLTTTQVSEVQASDQLQSDDIQQAVKEIFLRQLIKSAIDQNEARQVLTGVTVMDLSSHRTLVEHNQNTQHFAASINKLPISLLVLEDLRAGKLDMNQVVTWQASDVRGGFGTFDQPGAPLQAPLHDVLYDMLNRSGNTVVRATVNYLLGGPQAVNDRFATKPQLSNTELIVLTPTSFFLGNSTPNDSMWAMDKLMENQDRHARFMKDAMATNIFEDFGVRSQLLGNNYILLVNKIGLLDDPEGNNRHDVGIIYNKHTHKSYGYSFFTTSPFESTTATPRADQSLKDMGRYVDRKRADQRDPDTRRSLRQLPQAERRIRY